jgi:ATPase subunit of ABC transporter with duplicated ATPase domains
MSAFLTLDRLSLSSPDGRLLFSDLTFSLGRERIGLVGRNGSGKSTLLRAIVGGAEPSAGTISVAAKVGSLRQVAGPVVGTVAHALDAAADLARLHRIERGAGTPDDFECADWLLPARISAALTEAGLHSIEVDRAVSTLSGGERMRVALAKLLLEQPDILLLDEPTNDLDADGRAAVSHLLANWRGGAIVASHDRALLEQVDRIVALSPVGITTVAGGWSAYEAEWNAARDSADQVAQRAEQDLRASRRA